MGELTNTEKIIKLLDAISNKLSILIKRDTLPQIDEKKHLSFLLDLTNSRWVSFRPMPLNNMRLFGYYYDSAPVQLSNIEEGWIPLRVDVDGKLKVNTT